MGLVAVGVVPWMVLMSVAKRRTATFTAQLPDMLQLLGTTLRSGFSILQGLTTVSQHRVFVTWSQTILCGASVPCFLLALRCKRRWAC